MFLKPLTYSVGRTADQIGQALESTMLPDNPYGELLARHKVEIRCNGAGNFFLIPPVRYLHYKLRMDQSADGETEIRLQPVMRTFFQLSTLAGYLICLLMAFVYMPLVMGQAVPLLDVLVVVMFPIAYFYNVVFGHRQSSPVADAFMKEFIEKTDALARA